MAQNVRFFLGTREQYDSITNHNPLALYFCEDTGELFRGSQCISDGIRVIPTYADLPDITCAADGILYYVHDTRNGYTLSPDRTEWLQTIYAPTEDVTKIPESEIYNTVTTVGAVRDIEKAIYKYIDEEIDKVEVSGGQGKDGVGISSAEVNANGELVLYFTNDTSINLGKVVGSDGKDGVDGKDGKDGENGAPGQDGANGTDGIDGVGISTVVINESNELVVTLSNGTIINLGNVKGDKGEDGKDGQNGADGAPGQNGEDGVGIVRSEINESGELVLTYSDNTSANLGRVVGNDGKDGTDGEPGRDGVDGKDGQNGTNGVDGKDGVNGVDGKDGESAYEIWLGAGHSGSESDFLQWLKGDSEPFENVVTSISCGGIEAGTSLKGKTVKDVLTMLLGIQAPSNQPAVDYIIENSIPFYSGLEGEEHSEVTYQQLDTATADYKDQGFYTTTNEDGEITNAGYQVSFEENEESVAQTFAVCITAKIVTAYQYFPALNQWVDMGFDGTYWVENGTVTETINGQEVTYVTYKYNEEVMGDVIVSPEYWRFEVEVL